MALTGIVLAAAIAATNVVNASETAEIPAKTNRMAKITAASTYYDSKDGIAYFSGHVYVDDEEYQLHSDSAYVFMDKTGTNTLKRIVAVGDVALTNGNRRAYGAKASYYREAGMVVLYAPEGGQCEVRDENDGSPRSVKGSKIKFWIGSKQVQVEKAAITAPVSGDGMQGLKTLTGENRK